MMHYLILIYVYVYIDNSNKLFQCLKRKGSITDKELKYFLYNYKNSTNLGKLYLLPKIHKRLSNVPGRPVISNCGTPTEKTSEFLDHHLKPIMQKGKSYIRDSGDFIGKIKILTSIPSGPLLVTADVVGLYPNIPHDLGLKALREALAKRENKSVATDELVKMAEFVLKNNYFEFNGGVKQHISWTAIGTKFAPPYACKGKSYIRDSGDFIGKIKILTSIPSGSLLVTADVVGLYPNIPHDLGLKALREALAKRENKSVATDELVKMAEFVLKNNYFEFNGGVKQQISWTAIGTKFAPPYACIFMDQVETDFLQTQKFQPLVWFRYIDDIFFIWTHGEENLREFLEEFNKFHPNIKFTHEFSEENVTFLDLNVKLSNGSISTGLHIKPTDRHQYLHFSSAHPDHTKSSIIYSQALRVSRVCSFEEDYINHTKEMKSWLLKLGYPEWLINREMGKVRHSNLNRNRKRPIKSQGVPLVVTYHPLLKSFGNIIKKHLTILYMNEEVKNVFNPGPMISFRGARKLNSYLVRAKLYPLEGSVGSFKCRNRRCQVCDNVTETITFKSSVTSNEYKINHSFNCNEKCLI